MITKIGEDIIKLKEDAAKNIISKAKDLPSVSLNPKTQEYYSTKDNNSIAVFNNKPDSKFFGVGQDILGNDTELEYFWVDPKYRGKGVGSKLLSHVLNKHKDEYIGIGTGAETNDAAKHLYKKHGFGNYHDFGDKDRKWWLRKPDTVG